MPKINCAIYTRKSTERGLDMEFNSLQNQEEACKAYILSQAFNGWGYIKTYSDGGISGETVEQPILQHFLTIFESIIFTKHGFSADRARGETHSKRQYSINFDNPMCMATRLILRVATKEDDRKGLAHA